MRTKYMVVVALVLSIFFVSALIENGATHISSLTRVVPEPQFVEAPYMVHAETASEESVWENQRASLIAVLKERLSDTVPVIETRENIIQDESPTEIDTEIDLRIPAYSHIPQPGTIYSCSGDIPVQAPHVRTWGDVVITRTEGARVFSHTVTNASGTSQLIPVVQLPESPFVSRTPICLTDNLIGIHVGGDLLKAGVRYDNLTTDADGRIGFALDGFALYSMYEDGHRVEETDLDVCHGHTHTILSDGVSVSTYHYHITDTFPYSVGCFMSIPVTLH